MNQPAQRPGFQLVDDEPAQQPKPAESQIAVRMLTLSLAALSQRALVAVANLFTLATVGSVWWLWWEHPDPTDKQILSLGIYAIFILIANLIVRRK